MTVNAPLPSKKIKMADIKYALDIASNRKSVKYSKAEMFKRILWGLTRPLFRFSPRTFFGCRRVLLRMFGAKIGCDVHIYNSAEIYMPWNLEIGDSSAVGEHAFIYNLGRISIGARTTISHRAHLCAGTHDYEKPDLPLLRPAIAIGDQAWICADAFIGPGVSIGHGAVIGARSVVMKDIEPWVVVAGNPAKFLKKRVVEMGK